MTTISPGAKTLLKTLRQAKEARRKYVKAWRARLELPEGERIRCRGRGCDGCCYQMTLASVWEGALIAHYLIQSGRLDLMRKAEAAGQEALEAIGPAYSPETITVATGPWLDKRIPCPFLEDGACLVYGLRPVACSSYLVITPPELCSAPSGTEVCAGDNNGPLAWGLEVERRIVKDLLKLQEDKFVVVPLPLGHAVHIGGSVLVNGPAVLEELVELEPKPDD